jgi:hypothetical protein
LFLFAFELLLYYLSLVAPLLPAAFILFQFAFELLLYYRGVGLFLFAFELLLYYRGVGGILRRDVAFDGTLGW